MLQRLQPLCSEDGSTLSSQTTLYTLPAVKIPGASSHSSSDSQQQQLPVPPQLDSLAKPEAMDMKCGTASGSTLGEVHAGKATNDTGLDMAKEEISKVDEGSALDLSDEDEDFLDLLVDTFDMEFDPTLQL